MSNKSVTEYFNKMRRERYEEQNCENKNTKKERFIQALVKKQDHQRIKKRESEEL